MTFTKLCATAATAGTTPGTIASPTSDVPKAASTTSVGVTTGTATGA